MFLFIILTIQTLFTHTYVFGDRAQKSVKAESGFPWTILLCWSEFVLNDITKHCTLISAIFNA